jgi:hypothetical protein
VPFLAKESWAYSSSHITFGSQKLKFEEFHNNHWKYLITLGCKEFFFYKGYWISEKQFC